MSIMGHILHRAFITATIAGVLSLPAAAADTATIWKIDPAHTAAQFAVKHLMISTVRGNFRNVNGTINWNESDVTKSTVNVTIDATTVDTGEQPRDKDLKSDKFFDTADYPTLTFKSTKVEQAGSGKLKVAGDLTIRGVTKQVVLDVDGPSASVKDPWGNTRSALSASTKINRQDFGVKWNASIDGGGVVVGDDVNITIDLEMVKQK
jgi:polyisoprenoid-binding protein YceI